MLIKRTVYDVAGNFTHNFEKGRAWCRVFVTGGGAGGQGGHENHTGYGGTAVGTAIKTFDITQPTADVVVGAGGVGSLSPSYEVDPGEQSDFTLDGVTVSATGGTNDGDPDTDNVKLGGIGIGGDVNIQGGASLRIQSKYVHGSISQGGKSYWGGGAGIGTFELAGVGPPGSGGIGNDNSGVVAMCHGVDGCVVIEEFL